MLGPLFTWKFFLFALLFIGSIFIYRIFCRFICPLGAIYGLFNKFSLLGVKVNNDTCINCGKCIKECKMDINKVGDHECINCGECISVCPTNAIQWKGKKFILPPNEINTEIKTKEIVTTTDSKKTLKLITQISATILLLGTLIYAYYGDKKDTPTNNSSSNSSTIVGTGPKVDTIAKVGDLCNTFEITSSNGHELFNNDAAKGKITFLNFWNVDCSACIAEIPHFEEFYNNYKDYVNFVCIDPTDDPEIILDAIDSLEWGEYNLNIGYPTGSLDLEEYFKINNTFPFTAVLNKDNVIIKLRRGGLTYNDLVNIYEETK